MTEQFANNASTTLNGALNNSSTTVNVTNGTPFSQSGTFRVIVDSEIMIVNSIAGNVLSVSRGQEGTAAVSHLSGTVITQIMTAGSVQQFRADNIQSGSTAASLPTPGLAGRLFLPSNGITIYQDNGTSWQSFGPVLPLITPPTVTIGGGFSYYQQNGISSTNGPGNFTVTVPFSVTQGLAGIVQTGSGSPTMFVEAASMFSVTGATSSNSGAIWLAGVLMVESSTGKYCGVLAGNFNGATNVTGNVIDFSYGVNTTRTSFTRNYGCFSPWSVPFVRMRLSGSNVIAEMSVDRQNWLLMGSVAITTAFTTAPNQVGFAVYPWELASGQSYTANFFHYNQG